MPRPSAILRLPQPCPASWAAMTPTTAGRHCAACAKTVVDFSTKTDAEVLAYFQQAAGKTCGRFRADQLGRPLHPAAATRPGRAWLRALLALGSLGQLVATKAAAQTVARGTAGPLPALSPMQGAATPGGTPTTAVSSTPTSPAATLPLAGSRTVRGTVRDETTHELLPGATVLLKGTTLGISTDQNGSFTLAIPGDAPTVQLGFHYIGYNSVEQTVTVADNTPLVVALNTNGVVLAGEVMVIPSKRPWPWHPRSFFSRTKASLMRAFGK